MQIIFLHAPKRKKTVPTATKDKQNVAHKYGIVLYRRERRERRHDIVQLDESSDGCCCLFIQTTQ